MINATFVLDCHPQPQRNAGRYLAIRRADVNKGQQHFTIAPMQDSRCARVVDGALGFITTYPTNITATHGL
jgi:hypothetical protein